MQNIITLEGLKNLGVSCVMVKDDSPRGIKSVQIKEVNIGDYVLINNFLYFVIDFERVVDPYVSDKEIIFFSNVRGEAVEVHLTSCNAEKSYKNDLMVLWSKNGWCEFIQKRINVEVFVTDKKGACHNWYNPQVKESADGKRLVINFDWILEDTKNNRDRIISKIIELANSKESEYKNIVRSEV